MASPRIKGYRYLDAEVPRVPFDEEFEKLIEAMGVDIVTRTCEAILLTDYEGEEDLGTVPEGRGVGAQGLESTGGDVCLRFRAVFRTSGLRILPPPGCDSEREAGCTPADCRAVYRPSARRGGASDCAGAEALSSAPLAVDC